jgi:hypothetical protein
MSFVKKCSALDYFENFSLQQGERSSSCLDKTQCIVQSTMERIKDEGDNVLLCTPKLSPLPETRRYNTEVEDDLNTISNSLEAAHLSPPIAALDVQSLQARVADWTKIAHEPSSSLLKEENDLKGSFDSSISQKGDRLSKLCEEGIQFCDRMLSSVKKSETAARPQVQEEKKYPTLPRVEFNANNFNECKVPYEYCELSENASFLDKAATQAVRAAFKLYEKTGQYSLPQIIIDDREKVREINLSGLLLYPRSISLIADLFPNVTLLNLQSCTNTDGVLPELKSFSKLHCLELGKSDVTGKTFSSLPKSLKQLICDRCDSLEESSMQALEAIPLEVFDVEECQIQGTYFSSLPKTLRELVCQQCPKLREEAIASLEGLLKLQELYISRTPIRGTYFEKLPKSLRVLSAWESCLTDEELLKLSHYEALEELYIGGTSIKGKYFDRLPKSLVILDCMECSRLPDGALSLLEHYENLRELYLERTNIKGTYFSKLPKSLEKLVMKECEKLQEEAILGLEHCEALEEVRLKSTQIRGTFFASFPKSLEILDCAECHNLNDAAIGALESKHKLEELYLSKTSIKGTSFSKLSKTLRVLDCNECHKLSNKAILELKEFRELEELNVGGTPLTGQYFEFLPKSLEKLAAWDCPIPDEPFEKLERCCELEKLYISETPITGKCFLKFPKSLVILDCEGCKKLMEESMLYLQHCEHLNELDLTDTKIFGRFFPQLPPSLRKIIINGGAVLRPGVP